jgi:hypothetical protein
MFRSACLVVLLSALVDCTGLKSNDLVGFDASDASIDATSESAPDAVEEPAVANVPDAPPEALVTDAPAETVTSEDAPVADVPGAGEPAFDGPPEEMDAPEPAPEAAPDVQPDAGWTPLSLRGLALWLDAATGVEVDGADVTGWRDQSPYHHHAFAPFATLRPVLLDQGLGRHPAVAFAAMGDMLVVSDDPSLRFGTKDMIVEMVLRHSTPTTPLHCTSGYALLFGKALTNPPWRGMSLFANYPTWNMGVETSHPLYGAQLDNLHSTTTTDGVPYNDDVPRIFAAYRDSNYLRIRVNGAPAGLVYMPPENGAPVNLDAPGSNIGIGSDFTDTQCLRGAIAEIVVATDVTLEDLTALDAYLFDKYADALRKDASK